MHLNKDKCVTVSIEVIDITFSQMDKLCNLGCIAIFHFSSEEEKLRNHDIHVIYITIQYGTSFYM